jgi:hypothetical protein
MPDTITPNYDLIKPEVTGSVDTWGSKLNGNFDILDNAIKTTWDRTDTALQRTGLLSLRTTDDYIFLKSGLTPHLQGNDAIMNNASVRALLNALCPIGTIAMWGGTVAAIPAGWALCDGRTVGSVTTPNLTSRFVIGAGAPLTGFGSPGYQSGQTNFTYSGVVGGHLLTTAEIPAHNHDVYDPTHTHGVNDPGHAHSYVAGNAGSNYGSGPGSQSDPPVGKTTGAAATGVYLAYAGTGISLYNRGGSQYHDHPIAMAIPGPTWYPPFYTLVLMMRVQAF